MRWTRSAALAVPLLAGALAAPAGHAASGTAEVALPYSGPVAESAVAVDPHDPRRVVVAAIGFGAHDYAEAMQHGYQPDDQVWRSLDGGRSFALVGRLPYRKPASESSSDDPSLAWDPHGPLYAAYLANQDGGYLPGETHDGLWVARSDDGGAHWRGVVAAANTYGQDHCTGPDRPTVAVDPVRGTVWVAYQHLVLDSSRCLSPTAIDTRVVRSRDGGRTWSKPVVVAPALTTAGVGAVLPDGSFAVTYLGGEDVPLPARHCGYYSSLLLRTVSPALRLGTPRVLQAEVCTGSPASTVPASFHTIPPNPTVAVERRTGSLAIGIMDAQPAGPVARLFTTRDSGRHVVSSAVSAGPGATPVMPQLAAGDGALALSYLAALPGGVYVPRLTWSRDAGRSWAPAVDLAPQPSLGDARPTALFLDPFSIGHYQGLAIGSDGRAVASWPDLRPGTTPEAVRTFVRAVPTR